MPTKTITAASARRPSDVARERIIAAARGHFFAHGFRGVTMDDLAGELGMSKKTFYAHFPSKIALLEAVMMAKMNEVETSLERAMFEGPQGFPARLQAMLSTMRTHTEEISAAYIRDVRRETPEFFALVQQRRRELIQRFFGKLIEDGRKAGMIRKDIPATMMIEMLLGTVDAVVNPVKMEELDTTPKVAFYQIITIFLEGALTAKGKEKS
jgi:AcrR family transcriptional regulator